METPEANDGSLLRIYDPQKGQDFSFRSGDSNEAVSSLSRNWVVAFIEPRFALLSEPNKELASILRLELCKNDSGQGIVCGFALPRERLGPMQVTLREIGQGTVGIFPPSSENISQALALFDFLEYGELTIAVAEIEDVSSILESGKRPVDSVFGADAFYILSRAKRLHWFVSFDAENGNTTIVVPVGSLASVIFGKLNSVAYQKR